MGISMEHVPCGNRKLQLWRLQQLGNLGWLGVVNNWAELQLAIATY